MRSQANLRVILNTLVWPQMVCEKVDRKSIRLTALNPEGGVRVCLVKVTHIMYINTLSMYLFIYLFIYIFFVLLVCGERP